MQLSGYLLFKFPLSSALQLFGCLSHVQDNLNMWGFFFFLTKKRQQAVENEMVESGSPVPTENMEIKILSPEMIPHRKGLDKVEKTKNRTGRGQHWSSLFIWVFPPIFSILLIYLHGFNGTFVRNVYLRNYWNGSEYLCSSHSVLGMRFLTLKWW